MPRHPLVAVVAPRLGRHDGVSVEAAKWAWALSELGCVVRTVAGEGSAEVLLEGLASAAPHGPDPGGLDAALAGADLVVVENLCSLPINQAAADAVAGALSGRPAILHHHDLASQRATYAHRFPPPDDASWLHVTINELSAAELAAAGIAATVVRNRFDPDPAPGRRDLARAALGLDLADRLLVHPVRAIPRKQVPAALAIAELAGAVYWLLGPAEDGYGGELERLLAASTVPVRRGWPDPPPGEPPFEPTDLYAACDGVLLPSSWEGFGNPSVESATHGRPLAVGDYPAAGELRRLGFSWFDAASADGREAFCRFLDDPDPRVLDANRAVARRELSLADLPATLAPLLGRSLGASVR